MDARGGNNTGGGQSPNEGRHLVRSVIVFGLNFACIIILASSGPPFFPSWAAVGSGIRRCNFFVVLIWRCVIPVRILKFL